jgi:flagellar hook-length control protein FliK
MEIMQAAASADGSQSRGTSEAASETARPASGANAAVQHGAPDPKVLLPEAARAAAHEPAAARVTDADRLRFIQRVSRAFQANGNQDGHLKIRLSPPELGALRLEITVRDGTVNAKLEAETPAAQQLLLENLPVLRERLAQQDIKVERFDIELMDQQGGNASPESDQQANSDRARRGAASNRAGSATNVESLATVTERTPRVSSNGRLNVVI